MKNDLTNMKDAELDKLIEQAAEIKKKRAEEKRQEEMSKLDEKVKELKEMASSLGLSCKVELSSGGRSRGSSAPRAKVPPKYRNPDNTNEVWTGRGNKPRWVRAKLEAGAKLDDLLIKK